MTVEFICTLQSLCFLQLKAALERERTEKEAVLKELSEALAKINAMQSASERNADERNNLRLQLAKWVFRSWNHP